MTKATAQTKGAGSTIEGAATTGATSTDAFTAGTAKVVGPVITGAGMTDGIGTMIGAAAGTKATGFFFTGALGGDRKSVV